MATKKHPRKIKVYGRINEEQDKIIQEIIADSNFVADKSDVVSAALDVLFLLRERFPLGADLRPKLPWIKDTEGRKAAS